MHRYSQVDGMAFSHFFESALGSKCTCDAPYDLYRSMVAHLEHISLHTSKYSACPKPLEVLGDWVVRQVNSSFEDRKTTLLVLGPSGTGKSTLCRMVTNCYPKFFVAGGLKFWPAAAAVAHGGVQPSASICAALPHGRCQLG
jgi:polynucleotide 5'-kinase involved in rRNA processing